MVVRPCFFSKSSSFVRGRGIITGDGSNSGFEAG